MITEAFYYFFFFNKWSILVHCESSCFMRTCLFGRLKYTTRMPDSFYTLRRYDSTLCERQANIKRAIQSGGNSALTLWDEKGKIKTSKRDYYTFYQTSLFSCRTSCFHHCSNTDARDKQAQALQRIKGLRVVFRQLLPFLVMLIWGIRHTWPASPCSPHSLAWQQGKAPL